MTEKNRLGDALRDREAAAENQWAAARDAELLAKLRKQASEHQARQAREQRLPRTFNRVICAVDFGSSSIKALQLAHRVSMENDAALFIVHVCPTISVPMGGSVTTSPDDEKVSSARLGELAGRYLAGSAHHLAILRGDPATRILELRQALNADLIVMGTHGRRGVQRLVLGSVAGKVVRDATCPVLTVHGGAVA